MRPIGSTSEADTEFDRMKQVGLFLHCVTCFITYMVLWVLHFVHDFTHPALLKRNSQAGLVLQEILDEVVRELHKVKDEIINGKQCSAFKGHCSIQ